MKFPCRQNRKILGLWLASIWNTMAYKRPICSWVALPFDPRLAQSPCSMYQKILRSGADSFFYKDLQMGLSQS